MLLHRRDQQRVELPDILVINQQIDALGVRVQFVPVANDWQSNTTNVWCRSSVGIVVKCRSRLLESSKQPSRFSSKIVRWYERAEIRCTAC